MNHSFLNPVKRTKVSISDLRESKESQRVGKQAQAKKDFMREYEKELELTKKAAPQIIWKSIKNTFDSFMFKGLINPKNGPPGAPYLFALAIWYIIAFTTYTMLNMWIDLLS